MSNVLNNIKCLNFNCQGIKTKRSSFLQFLQKHNIFLVFLQEWQIHNTDEDFPIKDKNYNVTYSKRTGIMWNTKLNGQINKIPIHLTEPGHHITAIRLAMKNNINIGAISYYRSGPNYMAQYTELQKTITFIQNYIFEENCMNYLLINGDFNSKNEVWHSTQTTKNGKTLHNLFLQNNLYSVNQNTFTHRAPTLSTDVLDLTVVSDGFEDKITEWQVHNNPNDWRGDKNDHFCITYKINNNVRIRPIQKLPKWDVLNANWKQYRSTLSMNMNQISNIIDNHTIDTHDQIDDLVDLIQWSYIDAAYQTLDIIYDTIEYELDKDIQIQQYLTMKKDIINKIKVLKQKYNKSQNSRKCMVQIKNLKKQKNYYQKRIRKRKEKIVKTDINKKNINKLNKAITQDNEQNIKIFWRTFNQMRNQNNNSTQAPLYVNNTWLYTPQTQIQAFENFFCNKFQIRNQTTYDQANQQIPHILHQPLDNPNNNPLQSQITLQELHKAWKQMKRNKATGPDNIPNELLINGHTVTFTILLKLFNICWQHEYTPIQWRMFDYVPVLKPNKQDNDVTNYRPLQISDQLCRTFCSIISNRLLTYCTNNTEYTLKYWNNAFQPNKCITDQLYHLIQDGYYAFSKNCGINVVSTDISGCYDSIHIENLLCKLYFNFNIDGRILRWLHYFLKNRFVRIKINNIYGEWRTCDTALSQGNTLSTILTAMYTNDINIEKYEKFVKIGLFVDDFHISQNPWTYDNHACKISKNLKQYEYETPYEKSIRMLQECFNYFLEWCNKNQFTISLKKTHQIFINRNSRNKPCTITINNQNKIHTLKPIVPTSDSTHKYTIHPHLRILGLFIDPQLTWQSHIDIIARKMNIRLSQLKCIVFGSKPYLKSSAIWRLYEAVIDPIWLTNIEIYSSNITQITKQIQPIFNRAMKLTMGQTHLNPNLHKLRKIINTKSIQEKIDIKLTQFHLRCQIAPKHLFQQKNWEIFQQFKQIQTPFIRHTTLWRAQQRMTYIKTTLNNHPNDPIPDNLPMEPNDKYLCGIKYNSNGFIPDFNLRPRRQVRRPPPSYTNPYPTNLNCDNPIIFEHHVYFHPDGSCWPNPGRASYAWVYHQTKNLNLLHTAQQQHSLALIRPSSIDMAELRAIQNIIDRLHSDLIQQQNTYPMNTLIHIYTDSQFCYNLFQPTAYPNMNQYYKIMNELFRKIQMFEKSIIFFEIHKVKAHVKNSDDINEKMNNKADKLAKQEIQDTKSTTILDYANAPYNYLLYNNNNLVKVFHRLQDRLYYQNNPSTRSSNTNLPNLKYSKQFLNDSRLITYQDSQLLTQIRMGYMQTRDDNLKDQPICECGDTLTVTHFLLECKQAELIEKRQDLFNVVTDMEPKLNEICQNALNPNITNEEKIDIIQSLLFPHTIYTTKESNEYENKLIRMFIIKMLLYYCKNRFPD